MCTSLVARWQFCWGKHVFCRMTPCCSLVLFASGEQLCQCSQWTEGLCSLTECWCQLPSTATRIPLTYSTWLQVTGLGFGMCKWAAYVTMQCYQAHSLKCSHHPRHRRFSLKSVTGHLLLSAPVYPLPSSLQPSFLFLYVILVLLFELCDCYY